MDSLWYIDSENRFPVLIYVWSISDMEIVTSYFLPSTLSTFCNSKPNTVKILQFLNDYFFSLVNR